MSFYNTIKLFKPTSKCKLFQQSFVQLQGTSYCKKKQLHILSWKVTGKLYKYFPGLSRTYKQNSRTFQDSKKNPGLFQDVATLVAKKKKKLA